jgi:hypothetical protein
MKLVRNTTSLPLRVPLGRGKFLHLGPGQTGQVADDAPKGTGMARLIKSKKLKVSGAEDDDLELAGAAAAPREFSHGHVQPTRVFPKGNRGG